MYNEITIIISIILSIYFVHIQEEYFFRKTEQFLCKKYKGDCNKCKAWSCEKYNIDYYKKNEEEKNERNT